MKLTPYAKILLMAKETKDAILAPVRIRSARKRAELEMAKIDERVAEYENKITSECSNREIDFEKIIELLDDIALAERRKEQFSKILDEMFPDEE